jgi:hypothetical protein
VTTLKPVFCSIAPKTPSRAGAASAPYLGGERIASAGVRSAPDRSGASKNMIQIKGEEPMQVAAGLSEDIAV